MTREIDTDVLVVGAGPCGLMLANELGAAACARSSSTRNPAPPTTRRRTPRRRARWSIIAASASRTKFARWACPSITLPTSPISRALRPMNWRASACPRRGDARQIIRGMSGSWSAAELPHRVSQKYVEPVLLKHAQKCASIDIRFRTRLIDFADHGTHVSATGRRRGRRVHHSRALSRRRGRRAIHGRVSKLGFGWVGEAAIQRDFMGGRMFAIYMRAPDFYKVSPHGAAWMYVAFNPERRAYMAAVDGRGEFAFHTQLRADESEDTITKAQAAGHVPHGGGPRRRRRSAGDERLDGGPRARRRPHAAGPRVPRRRCGASVHARRRHGLQHGDRGRGESRLEAGDGRARTAPVRSFWKATMPSAGRLRAATPATRARWRIRSAITGPLAHIEDETPEGAAARAEAGEHYNCACAGRVQHSRLHAGRALRRLARDRQRWNRAAARRAERLSPDAHAPAAVRRTCGWTTAPRSTTASTSNGRCCGWARARRTASAFASAARRWASTCAWWTSASDEARELYEADLALIRPDQIVAWRGGAGADARAILAQAAGFGG